MGSSFFLVRKIENESFPCMHSLDEWTRQVSQDNSHHVRTNEKNSGDAVLRLGTVIKSIFCAQSDAISKRVWWGSVLRGSSTHAWKLLSHLLPTQLTDPGSPRMMSCFTLYIYPGQSCLISWSGRCRSFIFILSFHFHSWFFLNSLFSR